MMKRFLSIFLALVLTVLMTVPVGSLETGDTIYFRATGKDVTSVTAYFYPGTSSVEMTETDVDGIFACQIPADPTLTSVFFDATFSDSPSDNTASMAFDSFSGDMYDMTTNTWSTFGASSGIGEVSDGSGGVTDGDSVSIGITGQFLAANPAMEIVSVEIYWDDTTFTYAEASKGTWDPEQHIYTGASAGGWSEAGKTITLTNHSNVDVTAVLAFDPADDLDLGGEFRNASNQVVQKIDLPTADNGVNGAPGTPTQDQVAFYMTEGSIQEGTTDLGSVTVTIRKKSAD